MSYISGGRGNPLNISKAETMTTAANFQGPVAQNERDTPAQKAEVLAYLRKYNGVQEYWMTDICSPEVVHALAVQEDRERFANNVPNRPSWMTDKGH